MSSYMTIQEVNYGGDAIDNENSNIGNTSNEDGSSPADKGTETSFGSSPWNIEETDYSGGGGSQVTFVAAGTGSASTNNPAPAYPSVQADDLIILQVMVRDTSNTPTTPSGFTLLFGPDSNQNNARQWLYYRFATGSESGTETVTIGGGEVKLAMMYAYRNVATSSWYESASSDSGTTDDIYAPSVTTSGTNSLAVAFYFIQDNQEGGSFAGESGGFDWVETVEDFETRTGDDGLIGTNDATMASAGTISGGSFDMGQAKPWGIRAFALIPAAGSINYEVDFEYQWTGLSTDEINADYANVSIDLGTHSGGTEGLKVQYRSGSSWVDLGTLSGTLDNTWVNFTADGTITSTYTIRLLGADELADSTDQDDWDIDTIVLHTWGITPDNYEASIEIEWTGVDTSQANEYVCIDVNSMGSEDLQAYYYDGSWQSFDLIDSTGWHNTSVSLTSTFKIRLNGTSEIGDGNPDTWVIDNVLLHTWTDPVYNYKVNVEFEWTDADYTADMKEVCIYVASGSGENLTLQYEQSQDVWQNLGTLSNVGWNNFTAAGCDASTYTIRVIGESESGDSIQDSWDIDFIGLETASTVSVMNIFTGSNPVLGGIVEAGNGATVTEGDYGDPAVSNLDGVDGFYNWTGLVDLFTNAETLNGQDMTLTETDNGSSGYNNEHAVDINTSNEDGSDPANKGTDTFGSGPWTITEENMGGAGGGTVILEDTFTESTNTLITSHTPVIGSGYSGYVGTASAAATVYSSTDRVEFASAENSWRAFVSSDSSTTSEFWLNATIGAVDSGDDVQIFFFRFVDADNTYFVKFSSSEGEFSVVSGGSETQLASGEEWTSGDTIEIYCSDSVKAVYRNGNPTPVYSTNNNDHDPSTHYIAWGGGAYMGDGREDLRGENELTYWIWSEVGGGGGADYEVDREYQFTGVTSTESSAANKEVCVYVSAHNGTENLQVQYWTGSIWSNLDTITSTGWKNMTATGLSTGDYTIRLVGVSEDADSDPEYWDIDVITLHTWTDPSSNYVFETKFEWTNADTAQTNAEVCIYVSEGSGENLSIDYWSGSWQPLGSGTVSNVGWNNYTASGLSGSNYTIRLNGSSETGDTIEDSWKIDLIGLHTWTDAVANYELNANFTFTGVDNLADIKNLCLNVSSLSGNDNLYVEYEDNGWQSLGIITGTGWTNFTDITVSSSTFKIRFVGTVESSDTIQDTWDIIYIGLQTIDTVSGSEESLDRMSGLIVDWESDVQDSFTWEWKDDESYAVLDASVGAATVMRDVSSWASRAYLMWRYNSSTLPTDSTYQLIITSDGVNHTIDLLSGIGKSSGLSQWYVMYFDLEDITTDLTVVDAIGVKANYGQIHIEYIRLGGRSGFATDGSVLPDDVQDLSYISWSSIGFKTDAQRIEYSGVNHHLTDSTHIRVGFVAKAGCTYTVVISGMDSSQTVQSPENIRLNATEGRNDVGIDLSSYLTNIEIVTSIAIHVNGSQLQIDLDYLSVTELESVHSEFSPNLWEVFLPDYYGVSIENATAYYVEQSTKYLLFRSSKQIFSITESFDIFVGLANYSMVGSGASSVSFLADGLPDVVSWSPTSTLNINTDGRTMNLHIDTQALNIVVGENETQIVLDEVEILDVSALRFEVMMTGWFNGTKIVRNYTISSTGMVNWTTWYDSGTSYLESVTVWSRIEETSHISPLSLMESVTEISDPSENLNILGTDGSISEGQHSVQMDRTDSSDGFFTVDFVDFELVSKRYLHLSLILSNGIDSFTIQLINSTGTGLNTISSDGDNDWEPIEDYYFGETNQIWIDLMSDLDIDSYNHIIDKLVFTFTGALASADLWIDDIFRSGELRYGQDELRWRVLAGDGMDYEGYLVDDTYSDDTSLTIVKSESMDGLTVFSAGSSLKVSYNGTASFSTGSGIILNQSVQSESGSMYVGSDVHEPVSFVGTRLQPSTSVDLLEKGSLYTVVDLNSIEHLNITVTYLTGSDESCGSGEDLAVTLSTLNVTGLGVEFEDIVYLNVSDDYRGGLIFNTLDLLFTLNTTGFEEPSRYSIDVLVKSGQAPAVMNVDRETLTPLVVYGTINAGKDRGIADNGYIQNWIASPRDVSSHSLVIHNEALSQTVTRQLPPAEKDTTTVSFYHHDVSEHYDFTMSFLSLNDISADMSLDIALSYTAGVAYYVYVKERSMTQDIDDAVDLVTGQPYWIQEVDMRQKWTLWTVTLSEGVDSITVYSVDQYYQPATELLSLTFSCTPDIYTIGSVQFQDHDYYTPVSTPGFRAMFDNLRITSGERLLLDERFDAPHLSLLRGWSSTGSGWSIGMKGRVGTLDYNIGSDEPILGINPEILANPNSISAQLEFMNGWYHVTEYDSQTHPGYISGYTMDMETDYSQDKYFQHYYTVLDIKNTNLYELRLFDVSDEIDDGWVVFIDGVQQEIEGSYKVATYLREGLHSVYLRVLKVSGKDNAFKSQLIEVGNLWYHDAQSFVPDHGRYTAVYYDWDHSKRIADGESASFYEGATTVLDHADVLMGTSPLFGLTVGLGAEGIADYMMRDILTARYSPSGTKSPLVVDAGVVIFSSDTVPDTIFSGEDDNSILEDFLDAFGYVTTDGSKPFSIVTSPYGTSFEVLDSVERVMDLTSDTLYIVDGHDQYYDYRDVSSDHEFLDPDSSDSWASARRYRHSFDDGFTLDHNTEYTVEFSSNGLVMYKQVLGEDDIVLTDTDTRYLFPPGDIEIEVAILTQYVPEYSGPSKPCFDTDLSVLGADIYGTHVGTSFRQVDHPDVANPELVRQEEMTPEWLAYQEFIRNRLNPLERNPQDTSAYNQYTGVVKYRVTLDRARSTDLFISELDFRFTHLINPVTETPRAADYYRAELLYVEVRDVFNVYVEDELGKEMILPVGSSGYLTDIVFDVAPPVTTSYTGDLLREWTVNPNTYGIKPTSDLKVYIDKPDGSPLTPTGPLIMSASSLTWPYTVRTEPVSGDVLVTSTAFDSVELGVPTPQYKINFEKNLDPGGVYVKYLWKHRVGGSEVYDIQNMKWAISAPMGLERRTGATFPTDVGRMLPADLDNFEPRVALDTTRLFQQGRKFIDYAGYGSETTPLANPITFQASTLGGGIMSYGISTPITYEHVMDNSTVSAAFMQLVAAGNQMNLWGTTEKKDSLINHRIGIRQWDEIHVLKQQGFVEEWFENDGVRDIITTSTVHDTNGANWYLTTDEYEGVEEYNFGDTFYVRQPTQELTGWDNADNIGGTQDIFDYPMIRYPQARASYIEFDINTNDLDLQSGPYYLEYNVTFNWGVDRIDIHEMIVVDEFTNPTIRIDFDNIYGQSEDDFDNQWIPDGVEMGVGAPEIRAHWEADFKRTQAHVFETSEEDVVASSPLLIMQIHKQDPSTIAEDDVVAQVNNLVFYDYQYLRMSVDNDYAIQYKDKWNQQQVNHALLKPVMILVGIGMAAAGIIMGFKGHIGRGLTTTLFGIDIASSNLFETSIINEALKVPLSGFFMATRRDTTFMYEEGFSVFQFTSDHATNLLLTQLTFMIIGGIAHGGGGLRTSLKQAATQRLRTAAANLGAGASVLEEIQVVSVTQAIRHLFGMWGPRGLSAQHLLFLSKYLESQIMHLVQGTLFLFSLGAIGSAFGDGGLFAEVVLQMLLLSQVILGTVHTLKIGSMSEVEKVVYMSEMRLLEIKANEHPWTKRSWGLLRPLAKLSILGGSSAFSAALALDIASKALQLLTVLGSAI